MLDFFKKLFSGQVDAVIETPEPPLAPNEPSTTVVDNPQSADGTAAKQEAEFTPAPVDRPASRQRMSEPPQLRKPA